VGTLVYLFRGIAKHPYNK